VDAGSLDGPSTPFAAVRAAAARLLLLCLLLRSSWLTVEAGRQIGPAGVLHRRGGRAAVAAVAGVAGRGPLQNSRSRRSRHLGASPLGRLRKSDVTPASCDRLLLPVLVLAAEQIAASDVARPLFVGLHPEELVGVVQQALVVDP
jgi:hypothetical protein